MTEQPLLLLLEMYKIFLLNLIFPKNMSLESCYSWSISSYFFVFVFLVRSVLFFSYIKYPFNLLHLLKDLKWCVLLFYFCCLLHFFMILQRLFTRFEEEWQWAKGFIRSKTFLMIDLRVELNIADNYVFLNELGAMDNIHIQNPEMSRLIRDVTVNLF